jgi:hypothetical protein
MMTSSNVAGIEEIQLFPNRCYPIQRKSLQIIIMLSKYQCMYLFLYTLNMKPHFFPIKNAVHLILALSQRI